ncbi:MAG: hypothetical protein IPJ79_20255 [Bacteroidetes bacterium]|nr:hypothetical protein [Bacteroidota bacterium]
MADYSDKRDSQSLEQVINQTKENLAENGLLLEEVWLLKRFSISVFRSTKYQAIYPTLGSTTITRDLSITKNLTAMNA